jgi:hypothetical protein
MNAVAAQLMSHNTDLPVRRFNGPAAGFELAATSAFQRAEFVARMIRGRLPGCGIER